MSTKGRKLHRWTPEEEEWLRRNYYGTRNSEISKILGFTPHTIRNKAKRMGLQKSPSLKGGEHTRFRKGQVPHNKGRRQSEWMSAEGMEGCSKTQFRSGDEPFNTRPMYSERIDPRDGYVWIKVPGQSKFVTKHRWVWENAHGPIPKGMQIHFRDGDRTNCDISNLEMISNADCMHMNSFWSRYPHEVAALHQLKGALTRQINKHKRKRK